MLKKGILLYNGISNGIEKQLLINSGVKSSKFIKELKYLANSYIPKNDWRHLTQTEFDKIITNDTNSPFHRTIAIGNIPEDIIIAIKQLQLSKCESLFDIDSHLKKNEGLVIEINEMLEKYLIEKSSIPRFRFHRITKGQPNRETTTFHFINKEFVRYTGLHIDESKIFTPYTAYKSDNRISINISEESRYLYFVNLTLIQIDKMMSNSKTTTSNIVENFFERYHDYPIIRLEIKPFQYYIAPTDNFIHDGSTLGNKQIDLTIVYTGIFDKY